jgi:hypothetical protein
MQLNKIRISTQFFTVDILLLDSAFDKIPQCPARDPPPVCFTGVLLAGMVLFCT